MGPSFCGSLRRAMRTAVLEGPARVWHRARSHKFAGAFISMEGCIPSHPWCRDNSVEGAGKFERPHALVVGGRNEDHLAARSIGVQRRPGDVRGEPQVPSCRALHNFGTIGPAKRLRQKADVDASPPIPGERCHHEIASVDTTRPRARPGPRCAAP